MNRLSKLDRLALALAVTAVAAAAVAARVPRDTLTATPLCWSVIFLGRECPGCGLTRSFAAIGRGELAAANALNPLGPILFAYALAVIGIRIGKWLVPGFRWWFELDAGFAGAAVVAMIVRAATFYIA